MYNSKKVVVSMTPRKSEVCYCLKKIQQLFDNSEKPDIVVLNLSKEEFPNRLKDLPNDLVELSLKNPRVKIGWCVNIQTLFADAIIISANESISQIDNDYIHNGVLSIENACNVDCLYRYETGFTQNVINVLVINFGDTFNFTKSLICDLLAQTSDFDLTIIDNSSDNLVENEKYYKFLYSNWNFPNRALRIIGFANPLPLNTLWNYFYKTTSNKWLCFLNNDTGIPENFISDTTHVIEREPSCGIISHATNNPKYKVSDKLIYTVYDRKSNKMLHRQGWDFTICRDLYTEIPSELTTFVGDDILFYGVYKKDRDVIFIYSSPIIHYCSQSQKSKKEYYFKLMKSESTQFYSNPKFKDYGNEYKYCVSDQVSVPKPDNIEHLIRNVYFRDGKRIIVSMTTWEKRISFIPTVLDSILKQTLKPDKIVVNLSLDEFTDQNMIPSNVLQYFNDNDIEVNWVKKNTKVHKKIVPSLLRYRNDLIVSIDDDFIYPKNMIFDFYQQYIRCPNSPISGNKLNIFGLQPHCGCASMVQYKFYNVFLEKFETYIENCYSDDMLLTMIANENGYRYIQTSETFFNNMHSIPNSQQFAYSLNNAKFSNDIVQKTYCWLKKHIIDV